MNAQSVIRYQRQKALRRGSRQYVFKNRISKKFVNHFTRDLAIMLNAKMPLVKSIEIIKQQSRNTNAGNILDDLVNQLKGGRSFADCLRAYPNVFNNFYVNLVEVGEITGRLDDMLERVAGYLGKIADLKRKLIQALTYPFLVVIVALLSLGFILLYVIPTFASIFRDFDSQLPWPTLMVMNISNLLQAYFPHILAGMIIATVCFKYSRSIHQIRVIVDGFIINIPVFGEFIRKNYISHFCRTLGTLLECGVSLLSALNIASRSSDNQLIRHDVLNMKHYVEKGEKLTSSLRTSKIFPLMVTQMITVGEETAELPFMLIKISDFYDKEIDSAIETLSSVIEPVIIVLLGLIIGAILISIYLPLFNMANVMPG